jgi:hypothetical protein
LVFLLVQGNHLFLNLINTNFRCLLSAQRDGEVELVELREEERSARAGRGRDFFHALNRVGTARLNNINETIAARNVEALVPGVVEQVICVAGNRPAADGLAGARVQLDELRRRAAADKRAVSLGLSVERGFDRFRQVRSFSFPPIVKEKSARRFAGHVMVNGHNVVA